MSDFFSVAVPQCAIDIYPFEGGSYQLTNTNGRLLNAVIRKNIRQDTGDFTLTLAPGGPNGTEASPSWAEVLTPMSLAVIAMRRGTDQGIVMLGVVTSISEDQTWQPGGIVTRNVTIMGKDFGYFFAMFAYYSLWFLGVAFPLQSVTPTPSQALPAQLSGALITGTPDALGLAWYTQVMAGTKGVLSSTFVPYRGSRVLFAQAMATFFQPYPAFTIPFSDSFIGYEGSWINKFRGFFPFPWYEFFINTAPSDFYSGKPNYAAGYGFTSSLLGPSITASPALVARLNPFPRLMNGAVGPNGSVNFESCSIDEWNALPLFQPNSQEEQTLFPFISSLIGFSANEIINTYIINPTWFAGLFGGAVTGGNTNVSPLILNYSMAADFASIHRYGFRIGNGDISWFSDPNGLNAQSGKTDLASLMADILARYVSWFEPKGIVASGVVVLPLRPDIVAGCRFRTRPFKSEPTWDFYIEGVEHRFVFGGPSTTSVTLSQGLPTAVYADASASGVLFNALKGNAMRQNGEYVVGVPSGLGNTLTPIPPTNLSSWLSQVAPIYNTPQMSGATPP
jgi:hypothetical protein